MKRTIQICFICSVVLWGCSKTDTLKIEDKVLTTQELTYTNCKQLKSISAEEYVEYQTVDNHFLSLKHVNVSLNCCPDSVLVASGIKDGMLYYTVCQKAVDCNCNCYYDVSCKIGPLDYGTYKMKITVCTGSTAMLSINFQANTKGKVVLNKINP